MQATTGYTDYKLRFL